ncbi:hypothetical protein RJT34_16117 [Clitoria ternatea]|uniref:Uncharacterized protein n=1 Tax=Clitoria ternatea TaxID=43366 RepID=A0AAN9PDE0_CLITE
MSSDVTCTCPSSLDIHDSSHWASVAITKGDASKTTRTTNRNTSVPNKLFGGQSEREVEATSLILEAIDAAEGLGNGDVEDEVGHGNEGYGDLVVAALEAGGVGQEDEAQEDEEYLEEFVFSRVFSK